MPSDFEEKAKDEKHQKLIDAVKEASALTPKERRLAEEMLKNPGAPVIQQIRNAGYKVTEKSRPQHLKKQLAGKLSLTLKEFGIFEDDLAKVASDALGACHLKIVKMADRDEDGRVIGEHLEYVDIPDHPTRLAAFKVLCALGDYFPAKKMKIDGRFGVEHFSGIPAEVLRQRKKELEDKAKKQEVKASYVVEDPATVES
jgi:hypothetical protein